MGEFVGGFGTPHSPMLVMEPDGWSARADQRGIYSQSL